MLLSKPAFLTKAVVGVALCFATAPTAATAAACQGTNCVLPVRDAPPPPVETAVAVEEDVKEFGILPILAVIAAVALVAWLLLDDDEDSESP